MAIADDWTIDYVNKRIYHDSGTAVYSVNALYSYLQDQFDDLDQMDDTVPMSAQTPTAYTLINAWFIDDDSFQYLNGGAIQTNGWASGGIRIKAYDASAGVAFATISGGTSTDIGETITETDTGDTGTILYYDQRTGTNIGYVWIRPDDSATDTFADVNSAYTVSNSSAAGVFTAASVSGENLWANVYTLGTIEQHINEEQIYIEQNGARIFSGSEWWPEDKVNSAVRHIDVLIKVKEGGTEIATGLITVFLRNYPTTGDADLYDHFGIDLSVGGRNAVPLATSVDLNNTTAQATVGGYSDITIAFVNGTIAYDAISGTFTDFETVTGGTSGDTGIFLYQTTTTGSGTMTLGNVSGTFQAEVLTGGTSSATANATGALTAAYRMVKNFEQQTSNPEYSVIIDCSGRTLAEVYEYLKYVTRIGSTFTMYPTTYPQGGPLALNQVQGQLYIRAHEDTQTTPTNTYAPAKASPFGTFAGGTLFGAQGVWVENMDNADIQSFQLIDADGTTQTPPNKQAITITNLLASDTVSVFRTTGANSIIDKAIFTSHSGNTSGNSTFVVKETIPSDTPAAGTIRIVDTSDTTATRETRYSYTSWTGSTFSGISPTLDRTYTETDDTAYVPFLDLVATTTSASVTVIYTTNRTILVRVRRKTATPILPFETTGTFESTGYSTSAIRTEDTIVT